MVGGLRLPEHSHCKFCGDPVPFGEEFCDEECRRGEAERVRKERNREWLFWGSAAAIVIVLMAVAVSVRLL